MGFRPSILEPGGLFPSVTLDGSAAEVVVGDPDDGFMQLVLFERGHWCVTCRRHLSQIAAAIDEFRRRNVEVVAVTDESLDDLRASTLRERYSFPLGVDVELTVSEQLGLAGIDEYGKYTIRPAAIVVRAGGLIAFSYVGDDSIDRLSVPALLLAIDRLT